MLRKLATASSVLLAFSAAALAEGGYTTTKDIPFSTDPPLALDSYMPEAVTDDTPVLVLFHGGGWRYGSGGKDYLTNQGRALAAEGIIVIAPQFRFRSKAIFPEIEKDSAAAVAWAWRELRRSDDTPRDLFVGGYSSGAYQAALMALDHRYLAAEGLPKNALNGMIAFSGALIEIAAHEPHVFPPGDREAWEPATYADKDDPPSLVMHGARDVEIPASVTTEFANRARAAGANVSSYILGNGHHSFLMVERPGSETNALVRAFIASHPSR